ncbi:hypothetical protein BJ508DRAFT_141807 [Ascobolus immersus RN42]|uniref:CST complex subunit Stn1 N-terminal domain-containing protein n=1 Tax=Ascobolus immersus RN42 TaxID=1160509 RepID=A0A3N4IC81_ASCIM|nr:hypothetical protein BJ508DRAFT_141807 [Ascobolus immersus RN42]
MASPDAGRRKCDKDNVTTTGGTEDEGPVKMYPPALFQFSPTYNDWARLTAKDVHSLHQPPEMHGQLAWFNLNNPIRYVRLVGYIVGVTPYEEKTIITLDDSSTMLIDCVIFHSKTNLDPTSFYPGQLIKAKGEIMRFRDQKELRLRKVERIDYIDDEVEAWERTFEWKKKYWNVPWKLDEKKARAKLAAKEKERLEVKDTKFVGKRRARKTLAEQDVSKAMVDKKDEKKRSREDLIPKAETETARKRKRDKVVPDDRTTMEARKVKVEAVEPSDLSNNSQQTPSQKPRFSGRLRGLNTHRPTPHPPPTETPRASTEAKQKPAPKITPKIPRKTKPVSQPSQKRKQNQDEKEKENAASQEANLSPKTEITDSMLDALDYRWEISMLATPTQRQPSADKSFQYLFTESVMNFLENDSFCTTVVDGQESQSGLSTVSPDDTTVMGSERKFTGHRRSTNSTSKKTRDEKDNIPQSTNLQQDTPKSTLSQFSGRKRAKMDASLVPTPAKVHTTSHEEPTQPKFTGKRRTKESTRPAESLNMAVTKFPSGFISAREALRKDDTRDMGKSTASTSGSLDGGLAETDSSSPRTGKFIGKRRAPYSSARPMRPSG